MLLCNCKGLWVEEVAKGKIRFGWNRIRVEQGVAGGRCWWKRGKWARSVGGKEGSGQEVLVEEVVGVNGGGREGSGQEVLVEKREVDKKY
ncbi:hypothetical protein Pmani_000721 [Petrolisthes manimaculis]|uniref:Uncharacterized protein n=1 Tax=Petrolisthes manimaculis TaxID=1843537 RepID=A0AAE1QLX0_9EUCA|nr:hypothetical protein Pmani_000721 [Petrolisthes manimaculis]